LFKVMAYKDEYEVARLQTDPAFEKRMRAQFGRDARYSFLLHPPILRAIGVNRKIRLRAWWARPVLKALYRMRPLRGTRLDIFGYAKVRREERALIEDYTDVMEKAVSGLTPANAELVLELAGLPDLVRGYEDIKLRNLESYRDRRDKLVQEIFQAG
jgi:indolepyruvate ferredoxin oxidoreductase